MYLLKTSMLFNQAQTCEGLISALSRDLNKAISDIQGGSTGFGENSGAILVITSDISLYKLYEEKLAMVDCGIFIMNLVYALYENELGSCVLNCSLAGIGKEKQFRKLIPIGKNEIISAMIDVFNIPKEDTFRVAFSNKRDVEDIITLA